MLGIREPEIYGKATYNDLVNMIMKHCMGKGIEPSFFQSNHEGMLVDTIQKAYGHYDGIIINPAAYSHTSVAILDALKTVGIPTAEVHISNLEEREDFRKFSYVSLYANVRVVGEGLQGYLTAVDRLSKFIQSQELIK